MSYYTLFLLPSIALCSRGLRELGWPSRALPAACRRTCRASRTLVPPNYRVALAEFVNTFPPPILHSLLLLHQGGRGGAVARVLEQPGYDLRGLPRVQELQEN